MASQLTFRPSGVPLAATFSEDTHEWAYGSFDDAGLRHGVWRFQREDGSLQRVATYDHGELHGPDRRFEGGSIIGEAHYERGVKQGPYWQRVLPGTYEIETAICEVGAYEGGVRAGVLRFLDGNDIEVARFDLGRAPTGDDALKAGILSIIPRSMTAWLDQAERAFVDRRIEEGIICLARAVAKGADRVLLERALLRHVVPVTRLEGERRAAEVVCETSPRRLLSAMLCGAEPIAIFRRLASLLAGNVALDMIEAAIAIARDPVPLLFTRGVLRVLAGNVMGARQDARTLRHARAAEHELLLDAIAAIEGGDRPSAVDLADLYGPETQRVA